MPALAIQAADMSATEGCQWCGLPEQLEPAYELYNQSLSFYPPQVANAKRVVDDLQDRTRHVKAAIERLKDAESRMQAHLAKQTNYLARVHRLPDEAMLLIFSLLGNRRSTQAESASYSHARYCADHTIARRTPWAVSSVCKRWRMLALCQPSLWARIEHRHNAGPDILDNPLLLKLQLQRSGTALVSAFLSCGRQSTTSAGICGAVLTFLKSNAPRLGDLNLAGRFRNEEDISLRGYGSPLAFDCLQELRISSDWSITDLSHTSFFNHAQLLKRCYIQHVDFTRFPLTRYTPLRSLTSLHLWDVVMDPDDIFEALNSMPHLTFLKLWVIDADPEDPLEPDTKYEHRIPLLHLKSVCVQFDLARYTRKIAIYIDGPSLERFHAFSLGINDLEALLSGVDSGFHFQKCFSVTELTIQDPDTREDSVRFSELLVELLRKFPNLQRLNVCSTEQHCNTEHLFDTLLASTSETLDIQQICPQLEELHIRGSHTQLRLKLFQDAIHTSSRKAAAAFVSDGAEEIRSIPEIHLGKEVQLLDEDNRAYPKSEQYLREFPRQWLADADEAGSLKYGRGSSVVAWDDDLEI